MAQMYPRNNSFMGKLVFQNRRGYTLVGMKYGLAIQNQIFETLYAFCIPKAEAAPVEKPIIALPKGARYVFSAEELDFDDDLCLFGILSRDLSVGLTLQMPVESEKNIAVACHAELCYSTMSSCDPAKVHQLNETERIKKPEMSKYMLSKQKARIGMI